MTRERQVNPAKVLIVLGFHGRVPKPGIGLESAETDFTGCL
jgi:hypothetical protein